MEYDQLTFQHPASSGVRPPGLRLAVRRRVGERDPGVSGEVVQPGFRRWHPQAETRKPAPQAAGKEML